MKISAITETIHYGHTVYKGTLNADDETTWEFEATPDQNKKIKEIWIGNRDGISITSILNVTNDKIQAMLHPCGRIDYNKLPIENSDMEKIYVVLDEVNNFISPLGISAYTDDMHF